MVGWGGVSYLLAVKPPGIQGSGRKSGMRNAGLKEAQAGIKTAGRNINNLRYADDTILMAKRQRRTKEPLDESERGE